jgi:hypothetical protein
VGWIAFAAIMMLVVGLFNVIDGIAAIASNKVFVTGSGGAVVLDVTAWGWVHLVIGLLVAVVGYFLLQGASWATYAAILLVIVNMLTQMMFLPAYPLWSIMIIALDSFVLWALIVHGDERVRDL